MQQLLYLTSPYVGVVLMFLFLRQLFPLKVSGWKLPLYLLPVLLGHLPKYLFGSLSLVGQVSGVVEGTLACIIFPVLLLEGKKWKTISYTMFFYALQMMADCISYGLFSPQFGPSGDQYTTMQLFMYIATTWSIYILSCAVSVFLMRSISMRRFQPFYLLFLIFPVSHVILVFCGAFRILNLIWVLGVVAGLGAEIALLGYTISQERKAALEAELRDTRHTMELEQAHYKAVEQRQEELARIRHDFNNQLAAIGQLIRRGEDEDAQHMIRLLANDIGKTKENPYCAIPVVNAILTEKEQACRETGVALEVELDLPRDIRVEPLHLCSIFGNLLDNAIRGARESGGERPAVRLTSKVEGDYLFIKTENPAPPPANQPAQGHGYGSRILKDLAARYGGSYQGTYQDGTYTAAVSLLISE